MTVCGRELDYRSGRLTAEEALAWLRRADGWFSPKLSEEIDLEKYAGKIADRAHFFGAWEGATPVALVACYCNDSLRRKAFITHVAVSPELKGLGVAQQVLRRSLEHLAALGFDAVDLEVKRNNLRAQSFYTKNGFDPVGGQEEEGPQLLMRKALGSCGGCPTP